SDRDRAVGAVGQLEDVVVDVAGAAEDRPGGRHAVELLPLIAAGEAGDEASVMDAIGPGQEVEVVDGRPGLDRRRGNARCGIPGGCGGCRHWSLLGSDGRSDRTEPRR